MSTQTPMRVKLLVARIYTVEQLGVLIAVGTPPHRAWTVDELASTTRLRPEELENALHQLAKMPLLARSSAQPAWELLPDPETRQVVAELAKVYQDNPVPVLRALSDNALERIRLAANRLLAVRYGRSPDGSGFDSRPPDPIIGDAVAPAAVQVPSGFRSRDGAGQD